MIEESDGEDGVLFFIRIKLHIRETNFCNFKLATMNLLIKIVLITAESCRNYKIIYCKNTSSQVQLIAVNTY